MEKYQTEVVEKKSWRDLLSDLLSKTWNPSKRQKLRERWHSCSDFHGYPKLNDVSKLRKLAKLINQFCDTKSSVPAALANAVKALEKEGLPNTATAEYGPLTYLGYNGLQEQFYFKVKIINKRHLRNDRDPETGLVKAIYAHNERWGFCRLWLNGMLQEPKGVYATEREIDKAWSDMRDNKDMKIFTGDPKRI